MRNRTIFLIASLLLITTLACGIPSIIGSPDDVPEDQNTASESPEEPDIQQDAPSDTPAQSDNPSAPIDPANLPANLLRPDDLEYLGAFRLPENAQGSTDAQRWAYGGQAITYRPDGDPGGEADGFPGSLIGTGHDVYNYVSEINIPVPVDVKDLSQLNTAETLQDFHDIRGGLFTGLDEMPRVGLQYLPSTPEDPQARLHLAWGQHHHDQDSPSDIPSHAMCSLDLSNSETTGAWWIGDAPLYSVNGYMFEIPQDWANQYLGGARLGTGRYRDGGWSGKGPSLYAYAPWLDGDPPAPGAHLTAHTLLQYSYASGEENHPLHGYHDSDQWEGGAWLTAGDKTAVIFAGTKGGGDHWWYGYTSPNGDGMPCPHNSEHDDLMCFQTDDSSLCSGEHANQCTGFEQESKGWWSSRFDAQIIFYDPADFARVLEGSMAAHEPQPYAVLDIDEHLFLNMDDTMAIYNGTGDQRNYRIGEVAYDRQSGLLYIIELFGDLDARPIVHVWRIT